MQDHLGLYKSWRTSFQVGWVLYKKDEAYTVQSAGTDFLVLSRSSDGSKVKLFRNTPESYEFSTAPHS